MLQVYFSEPSTFASAFVKISADKKAMVDKLLASHFIRRSSKSEVGSSLR